MVEHFHGKEGVRGSSPRLGSKNFRFEIADLKFNLKSKIINFNFEGSVLKRSTRTDCKSVGSAFAGSNPARPTRNKKGHNASVMAF